MQYQARITSSYEPRSLETKISGSGSYRVQVSFGRCKKFCHIIQLWLFKKFMHRFNKWERSPGICGTWIRWLLLYKLMDVGENSVLQFAWISERYTTKIQRVFQINEQIELAHIQSRNLFLGETKDSINATKKVWCSKGGLLWQKCQSHGKYRST